MISVTGLMFCKRPPPRPTGHQISYIVCNFMYLLLELMHNDDICNWFEAISNYYQDMAHALAAVYEEACDNPDDFA